MPLSEILDVVSVVHEGASGLISEGPWTSGNESYSLEVAIN